MRNLLNANWIIGLTVLPIVVLGSLLYAQYDLIKSLLLPESVAWWQGIGVLLVALALLHAGYVVWCRFKRQELPPAYGAVVLVGYIGLLYLYAFHMNTLFPRDVARWMLFDAVSLYPVTFLMPTLAHAALTLIIWYTPEDKVHLALPNFLCALAVPLVWYLVLQVLLPLFQGVRSKFGEHVLIIALVTGTVLFLFLLARGVYILTMQRNDDWAENQRILKVIVGVVLPLLGLMVNNGVLSSNGLGAKVGGIFGDFTSPWFYGLALLNGVLLCLPAPRAARLHLLLYLGRGLTLPYTLYFFLVFLPFLPLSIIAIVAIGTGFLMLTPLVLLLVQARELTNDFAMLRPRFAKGWLVAGLLLSGLVLPGIITLSYWHQRQVLHQTLAYLYHPDYAQRYELDTTALATTLKAVRRHKGNTNDIVFGAQQPYLSTYYNWLVLDNLTLSNDKIERMERVFFGELPPKHRLPRRPEPATEPAPTLTGLRSRSTYDAQQGAWVSWVDLEITNPVTDFGAAEFATTLKLPVGCWVSDYYLYVGQQRVKGLLAEKKAATWVFSQIRNENKDPGILYYTGANEVTLRVFPFASSEVRRTGMQFLHKEPVTLQIAGRSVTLGDASQTPPAPVAVSNQSPQVAYVSAQQKARLPLVTRKPVFHFLLDASARQAARKGDYAAQAKSFMQQHNLSAAQAKFSLVDAYATPVNSGKAWQQQINKHQSTGGFYLAGALQRLLIEAATTPQPTYPVVVVVTDSLHHAVLDADFAEYAAAYPEGDLFYVLGSDGKVEAHSLRNRPLDIVNDSGRIALAGAPVRAWPNAQRPQAYLPNDGQPSLVLPTTQVNLDQANLAPGSWQSALLLHGHWLAQALHPAASASERNRGVRGSFQAGVLTPLTAYMVVENEAQRAVLRRKQEQVLAGNDSLDLGEDTQRMTEPSEILLLIMLGALLLIRRARAKYKLDT